MRNKKFFASKKKLRPTTEHHFIAWSKYLITISARKQFLWIKGTFFLYTVKEKISLNSRKFCWFKKIFFSVNKSISLDQRKFFWINKTYFNSKKLFLWPYIKETVLSVFLKKKCLTMFMFFELLHLEHKSRFISNFLIKIFWKFSNNIFNIF